MLAGVATFGALNYRAGEDVAPEIVFVAPKRRHRPIVGARVHGVLCLPPVSLDVKEEAPTGGRGFFEFLGGNHDGEGKPIRYRILALPASSR